MTDFLAIFTGSEAAMKRSGWLELDESARQAREAAGRAAWRDWMARNAGRIVQLGGPLGRTKQVGPGGVTDIRNAMAAWVVVRYEEDGAPGEGAGPGSRHKKDRLGQVLGVDVLPLLVAVDGSLIGGAEELGTLVLAAPCGLADGGVGIVGSQEFDAGQAVRCVHSSNPAAAAGCPPPRGT